MARPPKRKSLRLSLSDIVTRQPDTTGPSCVVTLGGTSLYAPNAEWLNAAIERIQNAIEHAVEEQLLLARNHLEKLTRDKLGEKLSDRVLGAVLGRSLRFGVTSMLPCLTIYGRILRVYFHSRNQVTVNKKLELLDGLLAKRTAVSVDAAQSECFPDRG